MGETDIRDTIAIRTLEEHEIQPALELCLRVFDEFESPDYDPAGTEEFHACL